MQFVWLNSGLYFAFNFLILCCNFLIILFGQQVFLNISWLIATTTLSTNSKRYLLCWLNFKKKTYHDKQSYAENWGNESVAFPLDRNYFFRIIYLCIDINIELFVVGLHFPRRIINWQYWCIHCCSFSNHHRHILCKYD